MYGHVAINLCSVYRTLIAIEMMPAPAGCQLDQAFNNFYISIIVVPEILYSRKLKVMQ